MSIDEWKWRADWCVKNGLNACHDWAWKLAGKEYAKKQTEQVKEAEPIDLAEIYLK